MNLTDLLSLRQNLGSVISRPIGELALCPSCGFVYPRIHRFFCASSQGMEWDDADCPTDECREERGTVDTQTGTVSTIGLWAGITPLV